MSGKPSSSGKRKVEQIMKEMRVKIDELDSLREGLLKEHGPSITPQQSRAMLEEIKVPSLEMIREDRKRHA